MSWTPSALMGIAALLTVGIDTQQSLALRVPLGDAIPREVAGYVGEDVTIDATEVRVAGVSDYLMRNYRAEADSREVGRLSLYVGYYERQLRGRTIHSPKNCLPGAGWQAFASQTVAIATAAGTVTVNRYLIQQGEQRALVLYWYQGRGRVQANEYLVKWDLLRDSALKQRSEEALVRIVVPIALDASADAAFATASAAAAAVVPKVFQALPE